MAKGAVRIFHNCPGRQHGRCPPAVMTKKNPESELSGFFSLLLILVRLAGIEPTTPWFVAKYSIQLSYSRKL